MAEIRPEAANADELPFRQLAQSLPTPCWISDPEGRIVWVNDAWIDYTGFDVDAIVRKGLAPLHDRAVLPRVNERWDEVRRAGGAAEMVFPLRGRDGQMRPFLTRVAPLRDRAGALTGWFGTNTDISAQSEAEQRAKASEDDLQEVFECAGDAIALTDGQGRILRVNPAAAALLGYSAEELLETPVLDLVPAEDLDRLEASRRQRAVIDEWRLRRKDGALVDVEINTRELSGGRRLAIVREISERRRQEARRGALRLQRFWEASGDLLAIVGADGVPAMVNEAAWKTALGYDAATLTSTPLIDLVHPDDRERTRMLTSRAAIDPGLPGFQNRYRRAAGGWARIAWKVVRDGELTYVIGRDVTQEAEALEALHHSERQFRLLVANVVDYALYMLDPEGRVASWNAGAEKIKGYAAEEALGRHFSQFYTDEDRAVDLPKRALATALEQGRFEAEGWRVRKDGSRFWASVVIDTIRDETGQHLGFAKITRDITERRAAQLDLQRAHERLAQAQKLEAMGQLTGGVAHDFNNLLMVVGGQAQLLRDKVGDDPAALRRLDAIDAAARRGQDLTRHLLAFARRQRLQPAPLRLDERAAGLRELIMASVGSMVRVTLELPAQTWPIQVDAGELELAILNMSVNARDAMPQGGSLTIAARNAAPEETVSLELAGDFVVLTIADTGQGIAPDILPKVFEPFFTTKPVNRGTGLGLSQVYGFAQQSGGRIIVDSELGAGTRIRMFLPRATMEPRAPATETRPIRPAQGLGILVVEDNPEVADVAAGLLSQLGHTPWLVGSADEAIVWLAANPQPDLVFSDIVMAGELDGLDLVERLRAERPDLPVLLATGYSQAAARSEPDVTILPKPYQIEDLAQAIAAAAGMRSHESAGA